MKYEDREESTNVEDQRGQGFSGAAVGGGIVGVVVLLLASLLGIDPRILQSLGLSAGGDPKQEQTQGPPDPKQEDLKKFVSVVLKDTETVWTKQFKDKLNATYKKPKMVLYTGAVQSACGLAKSAVGPFYCPADQKVYLDLGFFDELTGKLGAEVDEKTGKFAMAYVIAHEIGHHVQNYVTPPDDLRRKLGAEAGEPYIVIVNNKHDDPDGKRYQVRLELQADYLAGVWSYYADKDLGVLEAADIPAAMEAARTVGDDTLQKKFQGYVRPDSFTHGSSAQRTMWFKKGYSSGDLNGMHELFRRPYEDLGKP
jgi:predicted metalloprotease